MARDENYFQRLLFKPSTMRNPDGTSRAENVSLATNAQDSFGALSPTSSFRFDPAGSGLKNTQQLNIDFSKFENHTFFNSARSKVHIAFDKIINKFPFDGTRAEHEEFLNSINGFEKYVLDSFPKNTGFLILTRSIGIDGNYLSVKDYEGSGISDDLSTSSGAPKLDFAEGPFSIEFSLYVPGGTSNDNEIIAQRIQTSNQSGFTIALTSSLEKNSPTTEANILFALGNSSNSAHLQVPIEKGKFTHYAMSYDRGKSDKVSVYLDGKFVTSSLPIEIDKLNFLDTTFNIASGSEHIFGTGTKETFTPQMTLSGAMDEFRFFNTARTGSDIEKYRDQELYSQKDLELYFRFNEPSGSFSKDGLGNSSLVLDYSGNGMHTQVSNFNMNQRITGALAATVPNMIAEDPEVSPVLFPAYDKIQNLASKLMASASQYDSNNPNLITRLVPQHYLDDSAIFEGYSSNDGSLSQNPGIVEDAPGGNKIKQSQIVSSVLFMWADTFDDTKMFIDELSRTLKVDYVNEKTISDHLLPFLARYHGFTLPSQFNAATVDQFLKGRSLLASDALTNLSLQTIQNMIWRRILTDLPEIRRIKGTKASFRAVLSNMGINPDGPFRIREYGGSPTKKISDSYEKKTEIAALMNFSGSIARKGTIDGVGRDNGKPLLLSSYLSASRVEPGFPIPKGTITPRGSTYSGDGLLTSGSWTVEGIFKFNAKYRHSKTQSLLRLQTTGSAHLGSAATMNNWLLFNVVAQGGETSNSSTGSIMLYGRPLSGASDQVISLNIPSVDILDGKKWYVAFGRQRGDQNNHLSSSYFLRVGKNIIGSDPLYRTASQTYPDHYDNALTVVSASNNASGAIIAIGSMSLGYNSDSPYKHLNQSQYSLGNYVNFSGKVGGVRFFSKGLTDKESRTHIKNFKSIGVEDPTINFNFVTTMTGSFERLRLDMSLDQKITKSDPTGKIVGFDFSQNKLFGQGTGFEPNKQVIDPERFDYRIFSPKFELSSADNKIRIRSYINADLAEERGVEVAPLSEIPQADLPWDDRRFEVEISSVQALNEDIINIFATMDFFDNAIGDPELVFAREYRDLRHLRRVYFNRLNNKVSYKKFFEFFKWFDDTVGDIFEELVPRSAKFLGTNFVIESHTLERPKFTYLYTDMYLGELDRRAASLIYLQQFVGNLKKF
jgi:hypothetical protein